MWFEHATGHLNHRVQIAVQTVNNNLSHQLFHRIVIIHAHGVLLPIIVRPMENGYEIISGHRRKRACELLGMETMPAIVRNMTDEEAVILMADSNLQRENVLPSERAYAYKMKLDAMKKQGNRTDLRKR